MKKSIKKFSLNRETLLSLDGGHLQQAAGGVSLNTDCTYTHCCSGIATCGGGGGGGTRLC